MIYIFVLMLMTPSCMFLLICLTLVMVPTTPACTWWNRPEEDNSSGKLESTHPSRTSVKSDQGFFGVESVMRVNAGSLLIRAAATSTSGTLNDLTTDLIMANNNNNNSSNVALDRMNLCISDSRIWTVRNKLRINDSKTEFLIITSSFLKQGYDDLNIMVGDSNIISSNSARNLGVIFDKCIKHDYHICSVRKSTYFHLCNIGGIRNILSNYACAPLIHSLVTVRLDYCNSILYGLPLKYCCKNFGSFT